MPWFVVKSNMGFCGTEETHIVEADDESMAQDEVWEEVTQNVSVWLETEEEFETEEDAENYGA